MPRGNEWWILLVIALLLFGGRRLPELAKGLGKSLRIFRSEVKKQDDENDSTDI